MGVIVLPMLREKRNYGIINQEKNEFVQSCKIHLFNSVGLYLMVTMISQ